MKDVLVSIRMPSSLVKELKTLAEQNHYMDLSEEIRDVVRQKCIENLQPYKHEVSKLRNEMEKKLATEQSIQDKKLLVSELQKIIRQLEGGREQ